MLSDQNGVRSKSDFQTINIDIRKMTFPHTLSHYIYY